MFKPFFRLFIAQGDSVDKTRQNHVGHAGNDVLLLNKRRYAAEACRQQDRSADETARADDHMRFEFANNPFRPEKTACSLAQGDYIVNGQFPLQAAHIQGHKLIAQLGYERIFQTLFGAYISVGSVALMASAMVTAGYICPPVPPPDIITRRMRLLPPPGIRLTAFKGMQQYA